MRETTHQNKSTLAIACNQDEQELLFDNMVKLWVDNKINYSMLIRNYPDFNSSMIRKIINLFNKKKSFI